MGCQLRKLLLTLFGVITLNASWAPDYMIIGAQKSGTTAVFDFLNQHPRVLKTRGEIHFFDLHFNKGWEWYKGVFPKKPNSSFVVGDKSPYYLFHPLVPERVFKMSPFTKFIVVLRNPVDRAYSQYWMNRYQGTENRTFEKALMEEPDLVAREEMKLLNGEVQTSFKHRNFSYTARGHYAEQLERWFSFFPREQFLIIDSKKLRDNPQKEMNKVFDFLGLDRYVLNLAEKGRKSDYPAMKSETKQRLKVHFKPYNEALEALLDTSFNWD